MNTLAYLHSFTIEIEEEYVKVMRILLMSFSFFFFFPNFCDVAKLMIIHKKI